MKPVKIKLILASMIILATIPWITSCTHKADISGFPDVCFDTEILPIFTNSCAISGCHDVGGERIPLNNYTNISRAVVPGDPEASDVYKAITSSWGEKKMPPDQPLSIDNRTIIRLWIEQGAVEVKCAPGIGKESKNSLSDN